MANTRRKKRTTKPKSKRQTEPKLTAEYLHQYPFAGAVTMLQVLNRCKTTTDARDLEMAILPLDALELIRSWVVYEALGFRECCRNGLDGVLRYVAGTHFYTVIHFSPVKTAHEMYEMFCGARNACSRGHLGTARLLIECGTKLRPDPIPEYMLKHPSQEEAADFRDEAASVLLEGAMASGSVELVALLLSSGIDPPLPICIDRISNAFQEKQFEIAKLFIKKLETPFTNSLQALLLHWVCIAGSLDVLKFLFEQDPTLKTNCHTHPLASACLGGGLDIVAYLLDSCVEGVESPGAICGLMEASAANNLEVIRHLEEKGVDIHAQNDCAFFLACRYESTDVLEYLVARGVDVNRRDESGEDYTWLHDTLRSTEVFTHPHEAELFGSFALEPSERLLHVSTSEVTPVAMASGNGIVDVVKFLIKHGADVHANDEHALRLACEGGHVEMVDFLVTECNADVHAVDDEALRLASFHGECDVVRALVEYGADSTRALRFLLFEVWDAYCESQGFAMGFPVVHDLVNMEGTVDLWVFDMSPLNQALASRFENLTAEATLRIREMITKLREMFTVHLAEELMVASFGVFERLPCGYLDGLYSDG